MNFLRRFFRYFTARSSELVDNRKYVIDYKKLVDDKKTQFIADLLTAIKSPPDNFYELSDLFSKDAQRTVTDFYLTNKGVFDLTKTDIAQGIPSYQKQSDGSTVTQRSISLKYNNNFLTFGPGTTQKEKINIITELCECYVSNYVGTRSWVKLVSNCDVTFLANSNPDSTASCCVIKISTSSERLHILITINSGTP